MARSAVVTCRALTTTPALLAEAPTTTTEGDEDAARAVPCRM